ncbi:efflux RND transporter periplasmic adaptor subunit [Melioribacter sp. Ez-97]|uniref:efflux RND transporter periplasmic adaptor subunit n=1 Tax=Melioribacter sp. Ez-97 TaxID=3423434 RepID=UPI003ED97494
MNKKNLIYLIAGIIIGGIATIILLDNISDHENINTSEVTETRHKNEHSESEEEHSEIINISDKVMKEFGIEVKTAGPGKLLVHRDLTGEIVPNPYEVAHIVPRFGGIVKAIYKKIGDEVKKGDKIAVIESNESLVQYDVTSSIDGTILELHMTPGELIGDDKHIIKIANLKTVWAELNVYQQNLGEVKVGQTVEITSPHSNTVFKGKLFYISPTVDEATRTAIARVKLDNSRGVWKPGMFVSAKVVTSFKKVDVAVPKNAIQILEGQKVVFIKGEEGFRPQVISIGDENGKFVEILDGLHPGDKYVAKGAYNFKSEILKESFGGHGH